MEVNFFWSYLEDFVCPSSDADWEYEGVLYGAGNIGRFSFVPGEVIGKFNKVTQENYAGEVLWKSAFFSIGFHESILTMIGPNNFIMVNQPPSGPIAGGIITNGKRLGVQKPRLVEKDSKDKANSIQTTSGTGFLISEKGYIVTNYHVVGNLPTIRIIFNSGKTATATVVSKDIHNDLVLLKLNQLPNISVRSLHIGDSAKNRMGDRVFTIGYPACNILGQNPKYSEGVINAVTGIDDDPRFYQISVPIQPGNSGGPLFNTKGEIIGVTTATWDAVKAFQITGAIPQNVNYAIKSTFIKNLLQTVSETPLSQQGVVIVPGEPENSLANFIAQAKNSIVLIEASTE